jgi:hypothetical protein
MGARLKIERAKKHLRDLEAVVADFRSTDPYHIIKHIDPNTSERVAVRKIKTHPPAEWGVLIGDIVHNLRTTLDYLICEAVAFNGNQVETRHGFPIGKTRREFKKAMGHKVGGAGQNVINLVELMKPYRGGNDVFVALSALDIMDKHRMIIPAIVAQADWNIFAPFPVDKAGQRIAFGIGPSKTSLDPAEDGEEVGRWPADSPEHYHYVQPAYDIAFTEPEVVKGRVLIPTLADLVQLTETAVKTFEQRVFS